LLEKAMNTPRSGRADATGSALFVADGVGVGVGVGVGAAEGAGVGVAEALAVELGVALAVAAATLAPCFHTNFPFEETTVYTYPRHTIFCPTLAAFSVGPAAIAKDGNIKNRVDNPRPPTTSRRRTTLWIQELTGKK
jgi:hypothetical protein